MPPTLFPLASFGLDPNSYSIAINLFVRLLGAIYIAVYLPFLWQMKGLFGKDGIRPIHDFLRIIKGRFGKKGYYYVPTLFWFSSNDRALLGLIWSGLILGTLLMFGVFPPLILLLLYIVHLSLTSAGQDFLSFGWETFLIEITLAAFILVATTPYNIFGWASLNLLLFRFYFQAGASKLHSKDPNWRNLTALKFHYQTQPIPNTAAWYFYKLPIWFHKLSTLLMFYIELIVPFAIFAPAELRLIAFIQLAGLQFTIWFTGNFSYLNHLTVVLCTLLINNCYFEGLISLPLGTQSTPLFWNIFISLLGIAFLILQILSLIARYLPSRTIRQILDLSNPFHLAYPHGIFAVMTTKRYEIIIEGSHDGVEWKEYEFYHKPGNLSVRPRRISPIQPRLDWQAWFLPFTDAWGAWWFQLFMNKLHEGSPSVLKLLKVNPFPDSPPLLLRALVYDYEFTTFEEKRATCNWWKRKYVAQYWPMK